MNRKKTSSTRSTVLTQLIIQENGNNNGICRAFIKFHTMRIAERKKTLSWAIMKVVNLSSRYGDEKCLVCSLQALPVENVRENRR